MPAVVPFIPLIAQGVGMAGGAIAGRKAQKNAMQRSPEEQAALAGQTGVAGAAGSAGQQFLGQAAPWMQQSGNYYSTLLKGNRAAQSQAVAPYAAQLSDVARGEERNLVRSGVQGAARDVAMADIGRRRASGIAGLVTGMQPGAANQLGQLGNQSGQLGSNLTQTAGNLYSNLLGQGFQNRKYAREEGRDTAAAVGGMAADLGNVLGGVLGKKAATPGSIPGAPPISSRQGAANAADLGWTLPAGSRFTAMTPPPTAMARRAPNPYSLALPGQQDANPYLR
jgi:hypothetical protein